MDDKTQPSQVYIKTNNNRINEKDYNCDEKITVNQQWGEQYATKKLLNITTIMDM
jgi:hypothetical protein